jgi:hypothetical protein
MDEWNAIHRIKEPRRSIGGSTPPPVTKENWEESKALLNNAR